MHKDSEYIVRIAFTYTIKGLVTCSRNNPDAVAASEWVENPANHEDVLKAAKKSHIEMKAETVSIQLFDA